MISQNQSRGALEKKRPFFLGAVLSILPSPLTTSLGFATYLRSWRHITVNDRNALYEEDFCIGNSSLTFRNTLRSIPLNHIVNNHQGFIHGSFFRLYLSVLYQFCPGSVGTGFGRKITSLIKFTFFTFSLRSDPTESPCWNIQM
jgi:hypothetical protein